MAGFHRFIGSYAHMLSNSPPWETHFLGSPTLEVAAWKDLELERPGVGKTWSADTLPVGSSLAETGRPGSLTCYAKTIRLICRIAISVCIARRSQFLAHLTMSALALRASARYWLAKNLPEQRIWP
jgi:hypothetical protein